MELSIFDKLIGITKEQKFKEYVTNFRQKNIPNRFNQIHLVDELLNKDIDHYISISNRADGKSFNYLHFFINLAIDTTLKFMLISRMYTVRNSYQELIDKIAQKSKRLKAEKMSYLRTQYYVKVIYDGKAIGIITDLNSATNLKYSSNFLVDYPILIYDEFLALEGDYLPDEWARLKTIYGSVNREQNIELIKFPKLFYLGNAVNFSSPILANLNLFNKLEYHPINTQQQYKNIYLEMNHNKNQNEMRNLRAFDEEKDEFTKGQFKINKHNIATEKNRKLVSLNRQTFHVKNDTNYLRVDYNITVPTIILSIVGHSDTYEFNTELKDNTDNSFLLDESYYSDNEFKKHKKGLYLYDNQFTKEQISNNKDLESLKITKLIKRYEGLTSNHDHNKKTEEQFKQNYIEETKKALFKKFQ